MITLISPAPINGASKIIQVLVMLDIDVVNASACSAFSYSLLQDYFPSMNIRMA